MKRISITNRSRDRDLHIEVPGAIISIRTRLSDTDGNPVTSISVSADGDRYAEEPEWWVNNKYGDAGATLRIVQTPHGVAKTLANAQREPSSSA